MGSISKLKFEHRLTQMKYRLKNGEGQAFYQIGVHDKGHVIGLTEEEVREDLSVLYFMAQNLSYKMAIV